MKSSQKIKGLLTGTFVALFAISGVFAQEYDDMYFTGKDRKKIEAEKKARQDSIRKAEQELLSKNVNPDYMDRLGEENDWEGEEEAYYDENYVDELAYSDRPVTINNYYGYPAGTLDDIYWSNPMYYRYTVFDPFYRSRLRFYNSWYGFSPYDAYTAFYYDPWGGARIRFASSWGYRPYVGYYSGWAVYDPFFYDSFYNSGWSYNSYCYGWGTRYVTPYRGYYSYAGYYAGGVIESGDVRRGRRDSRSSAYGRYAGTNGVNSNDGRRPGGGRIDTNTPISTRRTSGNTDSRGVSSGRTTGTSTVATRGTSGVRSTSRSYNTYENRNMRSYTNRAVRSTDGTNTSSRTVRPNYSRTNTVSTDRSRTNLTPSIDRTSTRSNYNVNRSNTGTSYNRSNYVRNTTSLGNVNSNSTRVRSYGSSSLNRTGTSSYHRSTRSVNSGYTRSNGSSFNRSSGNSRSYNPSFNSGSSRSSGSSFSSGSRSSGSSSRSSGSSSSGSSRTSSRRGGN